LFSLCVLIKKFLGTTKFLGGTNKIWGALPRMLPPWLRAWHARTLTCIGTAQLADVDDFSDSRTFFRQVEPVLWPRDVCVSRRFYFLLLFHFYLLFWKATFTVNLWNSGHETHVFRSLLHCMRWITSNLATPLLECTFDKSMKHDLCLATKAIFPGLPQRVIVMPAFVPNEVGRTAYIIHDSTQPATICDLLKKQIPMQGCYPFPVRSYLTQEQ